MTTNCPTNRNKLKRDDKLHEYDYDANMGLVEKKQPTQHRRYSNILHGGRLRLTMKFGLNVANNILQQSLTTTANGGPKNVVCSPISIDAVLNIIALGAKGPTLDQLIELLGYQGTDDFNGVASLLAGVLKEPKDGDGLGITFVNALWIDKCYTLNSSFQKVDEVVKEVNKWAEKTSKGLFKSLLSKNAFSKDTILLLVNALYFKGTWVEKFKQEKTKDRNFYLLNGNKSGVPFMNKACQKSFSMYIFLPKTKDGLPNLLDKMIQMDSINMFRYKIKLKYEKIDKLSIPKFSSECELQISDIMKKLGLTLPFDRNCKDLTGIVNSPSKEEEVYVSDIIQNCRVEVDEQGTKAAAFTRARMMVGCSWPPPPPPPRGEARIPHIASPMPPPPIKFVADHPFLFMIREDISGAILFVGTMLNPLQT
ncbi:serpin-Z10-like [Spinacia oleracea]|uniref:Serpin-Z10-like n=1 Tax=Spinacia oleracea TaxID=3562 RepID=A0ABM3RT08_SPIOL|nr:serpin-Z10-like [Spinacia oleracea]